MFLISVSFIILGVVLFILVVAFYRNKNVSDNIGEKGFSNSREDSSKVLENSEKTEKNKINYIPVIDRNEDIPGLDKSEIIHFKGKGELFKIDVDPENEEQSIDYSNLTPELSGNLVLTSRNILLFNGEKIKKIPLYYIERFYFKNSNLVLKRKNVKKKRDVLKILTNLNEFKYILNALR